MKAQIEQRGDREEDAHRHNQEKDSHTNDSSHGNRRRCGCRLQLDGSRSSWIGIGPKPLNRTAGDRDVTRGEDCRLFQVDLDADSTGELALFASFLWISGNVPLPFGFAMAGEAGACIEKRQKDPYRLPVDRFTHDGVMF